MTRSRTPPHRPAAVPGNSPGEAAANLDAAASARLSGRGAQGASRLQTGMTHDYFILLAAVAFLGAALLIFGG